MERFASAVSFNGGGKEHSRGVQKKANAEAWTNLFM